jgi:hypothetical protein
MWHENIVGTIFFFLGLMYLLQITTWTQYSFRLGLVIRKYKESTSNKLPKELIKKEIICRNILFKFSSPTKGLFRAFPKPYSFFRLKRFPSILGEINIRSNGVAEISWRIPLSLILIYLLVFLILVGSNLDTSYSLSAILISIIKSSIVMLTFGFLPFIYLGYEKWDLEDGIKELNDKINSDTL